MTDDTDHLRDRPLKTMLGAESNRTEAIPIDLIVVLGIRRAINEAKVTYFMESIHSVGLLSTPVVALRNEQDGKGKYKLVAGRHRIEAFKRLGITEIRCTVLSRADALRVELAQIDENFIRIDPSPVEHALLTGRRREIILELNGQDGTLSQGETASSQSRRRGGQQTGPDVGSVRDHANKIGESKDKVHRSVKRYDKLGPTFLNGIVSTSLDTGVELNALMKLPDAERDELAKRAAAGERVSATKAFGKPKRKPKPESSSIDVDHAVEELGEWWEKYRVLWSGDKKQEIRDLVGDVYRAIYDQSTDVPEQANEPTEKSSWWRRLKGGNND